MLVTFSAPRYTLYGKDKDGKPFAGHDGEVLIICRTPRTGFAAGVSKRIRATTTCYPGSCRRTVTYSGVVGIVVQDQAVTESMGAIVNRTKEHLGTSDRMIQPHALHLDARCSSIARRGRGAGGRGRPQYIPATCAPVSWSSRAATIGWRHSTASAANGAAKMSSRSCASASRSRRRRATRRQLQPAK